MVLAAMNWFERQNPPRVRAAIISAMGVAGPKKPGVAVNSAVRLTNTASEVRKPKRLSPAAANGRAASTPTPVARVTKLAFSGLQPSATCSSRGIRNGLAPMPSRTSVPPTRLARKVG